MNSLVIEFAASFLIWGMFAGLIVLWFVDGNIKREQVIHALVACFVAWILAEILKQVFNTTRPYETNSLAALTFTIPNDPAFPSAHSALAFALAFTIWLHDRKVGLIFIVLAFTVGIARVLAHVHYPIDIMAGAFIGILVATIVEKMHFKFRRN